MSDYVAIDCGKFDTKTSAFSSGAVRKFKVRTKLGPGVFEDDMLKNGTFIVQVDDGEVKMFGYGAPTEPSMETSKKTDTHRIATLSSIAMALGPGKFSDVIVAVGVPLEIASNAVERIAYKDFILGKEGSKHVVRWKKDSNGNVQTTEFTIGRRFVYPEGSGALWLYPEECRASTAIIDIGNLNTNNIYAEGLNPEDDMCFTGELGGKSLISGIASALQVELGSRVAESMVAQALLKKGADRHLVSAKGDKAIEEKSGRIIAERAMQHVNMIRQQCDVHHWPLDFANIICIGGTTKLISEELRAVFGQSVFIPEESEYVNVDGFLRRMCATCGFDVQAEAAASAVK